MNHFVVMIIPEQNNSGSNQEVSASLNYDVKGDARLAHILIRKVEELEQKVYDLQTKKILDETQLPSEILEQNNLLPPRPKKLKRGKGYRPLLQSEIEEAKKHSIFAAGQARWLNVSISTYKKYARMYGIYEPKPNEKGKRNLYDPSRGKYPLNEILEGKHPNVTPWILKDKLLRSKVKNPKCEICGYDKRRIVDQKVGLLLNFMDGNEHNHKLENLQLLCWNCMWECGRGYIRRGKHLFDPDWVQGAEKDEVDERSRW
jgi:hypothetical protein